VWGRTIRGLRIRSQSMGLFSPVEVIGVCRPKQSLDGHQFLFGDAVPVRYSPYCLSEVALEDF
jgi:hypothetical protein